MVTNFLIALPPIVVTAALAAFAAAEARDVHVLSAGAPRTLAEAAVTGNLADAARRLEDGATPAAIELIRSGFTAHDTPVLASSLEAAVMGRDLAMFRFLERHAALSEETRTHLACLATDAGAVAIAEHLAGDRSACPAGIALAKVLDRP